MNNCSVTSCYDMYPRTARDPYLQTDVSYLPSRHEVHYCGDQGILGCFVFDQATDTETLGAEVLGEGAAQVAEGVFGALGGGIAPRRRLLLRVHRRFRWGWWRPDRN